MSLRSIKVILKDSPEIIQCTTGDLEKLFGFEWMPTIQFQKEKILEKIKIRTLLARKEMTMREKWLGIHYQKELAKGFSPDVSLRWYGEGIGYGVFAEKEIPKGTFVGEYTGLVRKRKHFADHKNNYCFEYRIGSWKRNPYLIDAEGQGNLTRFINHSGAPNLEPMAVEAHGIIHIILVSLKPIQRGEQLAYDYGDVYWRNRSGLIDF